MKDKEIICSIIITNYNGIKWLEVCLNSICSQTVFGKIETILVDDASSDSSVDYVKNNFNWVRIIKNEQNQGYSKANNIGAMQAKGKYLLLLNNDTKLDKDCLKILCEYAETNPAIDILVAKQLSYEDGSLEDVGGAVDIFGNNGTDNTSEEVGEVFTGLGACLFVRSLLWEKLGGFDEDYFAFAEDLDFFWKAHLTGSKVVAIPGAAYYHYGGGTILGGKKRADKMEVSIKRRYLSERNKLTTMLKNYSLFSLFWIIPLYLLSFGLEVIVLLFAYRRFDIIVSIYIKALSYNIKNIRKTVIKRNKIQILRVVKDREILKSMELPIGKIRIVLKEGLPEFR